MHKEETMNSTERKPKLLLILLSVLIMTFMTTLDSSILNVALPTLAKELNVPTSLIDWACTAYLISICSFALIFGKIADIVGKTKIFQAGTLIFTVGSLLCSISTGFIPLILSRLVQGIGASAAMSCNLGIITETYPAQNRAKALSRVSSAVAVGILVGPIAGGFLLNYFKWQIIFSINIPIGIAAFILGRICLPKSKGQVKTDRFDIGGSIFIFLTVASLISALTMLQSTANIYDYILLISSFVFLFIFILFERKAENPLIKISLFHNKAFDINLVSIIISFISIGTYNIVMPFYLQAALGYTPSKAGFIMTAQPIIMVLVAPLSGIFADKYGYRIVSAVGMFIFGCGALFQGLSYHLETSLFLIILGIIIFATGNALAQAPNNALVMSSVDKEDYGFATGITTLTRYLGSSIGLTMSTGIIYSLMSMKAGYSINSFPTDHPEIFIFGLRFVQIGVCAILCFAAFLMIMQFKKEKRGINKNQ